MEKNGIVKRLLAVALLVIAVIGLTMQETSVFAESLQPEKQTDLVQAGQLEEQTVTTEGQSVSQNELPEEESVSQNGISEEEAEEQNGTIAELADIESKAAENKLTEKILKECRVKGMNPPGVTVNLFDYSQDNIPQSELDKDVNEVAHDFYYDDNATDKGAVLTYKLGISREHLLRFGYTSKDCKYCESLGDYGAWNQYQSDGGPYPGIVKNKLGADGFPVLAFNTITDDSKFGHYADPDNREKYFNKKEESLAYLFLPKQADFKTVYRNVNGLFQLNEEGSYYYDSTKNFASYNNATNSFILYNSPGVAKEKDDKSGAEFCGQFFPFNIATDVFDSYNVTTNGKYRLVYNGPEDQSGGKDNPEFDYFSITDNNNSYIKCYAPNLNHYLGMTLEMRFLQPVGGCVVSDTDKSDEMIFRFSGDDDVWIFIDDVLVADLGGLHDACGLTINFATGEVTVMGSKTHTLYKSFVDAYGEGSIPGSIKFSETSPDTFADNTTHTLKMFYLERGHMASNLSLSFNIQTLPSETTKKESSNDLNVPNEDTDENEESVSDSTQGNMPAVEKSISSTTDNMVVDSTGIPQTGDDSLIWWWGVLCIISLIGIGATVCNLMIRKRKQKKSSSKK